MGKKRIPGLIHEQGKPVILPMPFHAVHGPILMLLFWFQARHRKAFFSLTAWNSWFMKNKKNPSKYDGEKAVGMKL